MSTDELARQEELSKRLHEKVNAELNAETPDMKKIDTYLDQIAKLSEQGTKHDSTNIVWNQALMNDEREKEKIKTERRKIWVDLGKFAASCGLAVTSAFLSFKAEENGMCMIGFLRDGIAPLKSLGDVFKRR